MGRLSLVALIAAGCGGTPATPATTPTPSGGDGDGSGVACEPGRCLEDISKLIAERRTDARACYDTARQRDPKLQGKIVINFAIDSAGVVGETSQGLQDGQIEDPDLVACVSGVINTVRFPASPGGRTSRAYHRFEFTP